MVTKIGAFDTAKFLDSEEAIAAYINAAIEEGETDALMIALSNVIKAKGIASVAEKAGLGRESLYKALTPGAKPRYDTVVKLTRALGLDLNVIAHA
ncbi:putative addiction module antidote protein [Herminiimonas sp. KBW02]|uniref:addiction module antidote protein n=1 Tax=Herminiimonas sp. KBW02 TaxID=2153363 RepID=UPI000F5A69F9|nr:addiction module antidote protein [Herminiimonas sp. KBW02]RQO33463.1 putative addiction module antidote protein [Herminiimonas sp. KBW02]